MEEAGAGRFYGCYLLTSVSTRCRNLTYIGFTVNPRRRIRQHNGEIASGARFTRKGRPWEMVLCIHGFQTRGNALQFEWAWQHPKESKATRNLESSLKNARGLKARVKLAFSMLSLPEWSSMKLTVQFFTTKYAPLRRGCQALPDNMQFVIASMDDLPRYEDVSDDDQTDNPASESEDGVPELIKDRQGRIEENENGRHGKERTKRLRLQEKLPSGIYSRGELSSSSYSPRPPLSQSQCFHGLECPRQPNCFLPREELTDDQKTPLKQSSSPLVIVISPTPVRSCTMKIIDLTESPIACWTTSP